MGQGVNFPLSIVCRKTLNCVIWVNSFVKMQKRRQHSATFTLEYCAEDKYIPTREEPDVSCDVGLTGDI